MHLTGFTLGELSYGHSVVGLLAASFIFAPLAILIAYYGFGALLVYLAFTRAERVVRWIGPSGDPGRSLSGATPQSA